MEDVQSDVQPILRDHNTPYRPASVSCHARLGYSSPGLGGTNIPAKTPAYVVRTLRTAASGIQGPTVPGPDRLFSQAIHNCSTHTRFAEEQRVT